MWFYIIVLIIIIYYTGLYIKLPEPIFSLFLTLDNVLPGEIMTDDIEGIYESENKQHGTTYFIICKEGTNLVYLKSKAHLSETDDPEKFRDKQILDLKKNVFTDIDKKEIHVVNDKLQIGDTTLKKEEIRLYLTKNNESTLYIKIRNIH